LSLAPNSPEGPFLGAETLYLQSFDQGRAFLALFDSPAVPFRARLLYGPFLDALILAPGERLPGAADPGPAAGARLHLGTEEPLDMGDPGLSSGHPLEPWIDLIRSLLEGLRLYGLPLGDPQPLERAGPEDPEDKAPGGPAYPALTEAQCFSRGWILRREFPLP
jgi:hypothetical protein